MKRYAAIKPFSVIEDDHGFYVLHSDAAAIERERDELRAQRDRLAGLLREVRPFVDHADQQFIDYPETLNQQIDAALNEVGKC